MKLAEVEQKAREQRKINHELAIQKIAAGKLAKQEAHEWLRQEIIAWMVQEADLDAQELGALLSVIDGDTQVGTLCLNVPEHQPITFTISQSTRQKDGGWRVKHGRFYVGPPDDVSLTCRSLGEALIEAGRLFQQDQAENKKRETEHQALLDKSPITQAIFNILQFARG